MTAEPEIVIVIGVRDLFAGAPRARLDGVDLVATVERYAALVVERTQALHPDAPVRALLVRDAAARDALLAAHPATDGGTLARQVAAAAAELWRGAAWVRMGDGFVMTED